MVGKVKEVAGEAVGNEDLHERGEEQEREGVEEEKAERSTEMLGQQGGRDIETDQSPSNLAETTEKESQARTRP